MSPQTRPSAAQRLLPQFRAMARIRAFETLAEQAYDAGKVPGFVHLSLGQEAIPVGVCAHLAFSDKISSTHRGHGHTLAKGSDPAAMFRELLGRQGGICGAKGGSMHIADFSVGMLGANGVVADGMPIAVGAAQAARLRGEDTVVVCFFGDGAINRGPYLESLNWAVLHRLPLLFVCEHNEWAATTTTSSTTAGPGGPARAAAIGLPTHEVDGNDVEAVDRAAGLAIAAIRAGQGPQYLTARTYRWSGHTSADKGLYRDPAELAAAKTRDPLHIAAERLKRMGLDAEDVAAEQAAAEAEIAAALAQAEATPWPERGAAFGDVQDAGADRWR